MRTDRAARSADYRFSVPVDRLPPGAFLLTIECSAGTLTVRPRRQIPRSMTDRDPMSNHRRKR
jgi:hypothetical protein